MNIGRNIRKFLSFIIIIYILIILTECSSPEWRKLDSLAPYAIPGLGKYDLRDAEFNHEVISRDDYGRIMYLFYSRYDSESSLFNGQAIIICQKVTRNSVYYYADICCLLSEKEFEETKVEELKNKNDWNRPLNEVKMKKQKVSSWPYISLEHTSKISFQKSKEVIMNELNILPEQLILFFEDDVDLNYKIMYCVVIARENGIKDNYFVMMNLDYEPVCMKFSNLYEVDEELLEFKMENGWNN